MSLSLALTLLLACKGGDDTPDPTGDSWTGEGDACLSCHEGAEPIHEEGIAPTECVICHGGDGEALTYEEAHVLPPANYWEVRGTGLPVAPEGYIKDFAPDQLDQMPVEYVRFINPGDLRAAGDTCGSAGCHEGMTEMVERSIMSTNAGHYMPTLYLAGYQDNTAMYGTTDLVDPQCDPEAYPGSVCELTPLVPPESSEYDAAVAAEDWERVEEIAYDHYLAKSCDTCHAAGYGDNNAPHKFRSTGCTSCHMIYGTYGHYEGDDPTIPKATPSFPAKHEITSAIPTEQCATCHFQGGRIGLLYRGIREAGFSDTPPNAEPWEPGAYGKANPNFYLSDEDTTNNVDETPPDVHYAAGMHCADCHVGVDVHGDGRIYSTSKQQVDLRCEDCHGDSRTEIAEDTNGVFRTSSGRALPQLSRNGAGTIVLTGIDGNEHPVTQVKARLAELGPDSSMHAAMGIDDNDWTHSDDVTCDTCHTSYNEYCLGCHVSMDMRFDQLDHQTGLPSEGLVRGGREYYSLHSVLLGMAPDGRAQSVIPSQQVQMVVVDRDGERIVGGDHPDKDGDVGLYRQVEGKPFNNGFHVFFQHTVTRTASAYRPCVTCHPSTDSASERERVRGVYGFGTGEFMLEVPGGGSIDALKFLEDDGTPNSDWVHDNSGPLPEARRDRAMNVFLDQLP